MKYYYFSFFLLFFLGNFELKAQQMQSAPIEKKTFTISSVGNQISDEELGIYKLALLEFSQLDEFRFLNERRTIHFEKNQIAVELFSANELAEQYGKEISPYTIVPGKTFLPVTFQLINWNDGYAIHPVYEKLNVQTH
jgi:hypothetical protein